MGSREAIEDGVEPLPALWAPVMTAASSYIPAYFISTECATTFNLLRLSICPRCGTLYLEALRVFSATLPALLVVACTQALSDISCIIATSPR